MKFKYRVIPCYLSITKCEIIKEDSEMVTFLKFSNWSNGYVKDVERKYNTHSQWFDTWDEAKQFLMVYVEKELSLCESKVSDALKNLEKVKNLQEV